MSLWHNLWFDFLELTRKPLRPSSDDSGWVREDVDYWVTPPTGFTPDALQVIVSLIATFVGETRLSSTVNITPKLSLEAGFIPITINSVVSASFLALMSRAFSIDISLTRIIEKIITVPITITPAVIYSFTFRDAIKILNTITPTITTASVRIIDAFRVLITQTPTVGNTPISIRDAFRVFITQTPTLKRAFVGINDWIFDLTITSTVVRQLIYQYVPFTMTCNMKPSEWNGEVSSYIATKDCFIVIDGECTDDLNHNGEGLSIVEPDALQKQSDAYIGWDLSGLPTGATVNEVKLTIRGVDIEISSLSIGIHHLDSSLETWDETTIKCNNRPDAGIEETSFTFTTSNNDQTFDLSSVSAIKTKIQNRMGVGNYTMVLRMKTASGSRLLHDREGGATNGPRLMIKFTKTA